MKEEKKKDTLTYEEKQAKRILDLRSRFIIQFGIVDKGLDFVLDLFDEKHVGNTWTIEKHIDCVGTGFNN